MRWGHESVGIVLTRNEIWLLLHALTAGPKPSVGWDGSELEPWVTGELRARLQQALNPEPLGNLDQRPVIPLDSDMGRNLAAAGVTPLVIDDGFDLGSLLAACADRGWGATLRLPVGAIPETPVDAEVVVPTGDGRTATSVGLERPVIALGRAFIAASLEEAGNGRPGKVATELPAGVEEHVIYANSVGPGEKPATIERMQRQGWELVLDEGSQANGRMVFRRPISMS